MNSVKCVGFTGRWGHLAVERATASNRRRQQRHLSAAAATVQMISRLNFHEIDRWTDCDGENSWFELKQMN